MSYFKMPYFICRLRNGLMAHHPNVSLPNEGSYTKILIILWRENLIHGYFCSENGNLVVHLKYYRGSPALKSLTLMSKSRRPLYVSFKDLYKLQKSLGILILSTNKGFITSQQAVRFGIGGQVEAYLE